MGSTLLDPNGSRERDALCNRSNVAGATVITQKWYTQDDKGACAGDDCYCFTLSFRERESSFCGAGSIFCTSGLLIYLSDWH